MLLEVPVSLANLYNIVRNTRSSVKPERTTDPALVASAEQAAITTRLLARIDEHGAELAVSQAAGSQLPSHSEDTPMGGLENQPPSVDAEEEEEAPEGVRDKGQGRAQWWLRVSGV
ncbi:hypothetical protein N7520_010508 [Penicillium odoratum]|uniref:uncharacterized protein n=1 Tax=Penicillium odoratum TaxID=1167516 RepID=UPI00254944E3|nr:uncharacterized protein N7520_010508 [Penicillium odoratum]KAJ5745326.1 hypothetical protein N7520_010508 [Penicillium odoratum]